MSATGSRLKARWFLVLLACIVAICAALTVKYKIDSSGIKAKRHPIGVGAAQLLVDSDPSTLANLSQYSTAQTLEERAPLYAELGTGTAIKTKVASMAGVRFGNLTMLASTTEVIRASAQNAPKAPNTPDFVTLTASQNNPVVRIYAQAQTAATAERLAAATSTVLRRTVAQLAARQKAQPTNKGRAAKSRPITRVVLRPLGAPYGATVYTTGKTKKAVAIGVVTLVALLIIILAVDNLLVTWREHRVARRAAKA